MLFLSAVNHDRKFCTHFCPAEMSALFEVVAACCRHLDKKPVIRVELAPDPGEEHHSREFLWLAFSDFFITVDAMYKACPPEAECEVLIYDLPTDDVGLTYELRDMLGLSNTEELSSKTNLQELQDLALADQD